MRAGGSLSQRPLPGVRALPSLHLAPHLDGASLPGGWGATTGLWGTHWHSGQARRPSVARPRRQPAQKSWKQSSRHGRSNCAWHSGHTSGWPLAASGAPRPSRGTKMAPDIFWKSSGRWRRVHGAGSRPRSPRVPSARARLPPVYPAPPRRGVQRSWGGDHLGPGWGLERPGRGEPAAGVRRGRALGALPASPAPLWWPRKVRPQDRAMRPTQRLPSPASTSPTSPHSHPRNSPPGVLWVTCRRHPFRAGPQHCSGTMLPCTLPRPAAAPRRGLPPRPRSLRVSPRGQRRERGGWKGPRGARARGSDWLPPGTRARSPEPQERRAGLGRRTPTVGSAGVPRRSG